MATMGAMRMLGFSWFRSKKTAVEAEFSISHIFHF